jgi:hypothetical protein
MTDQSNIIAGYLFAAFLVYVTMKGNLPKYLALIVGNVKPKSAG